MRIFTHPGDGVQISEALASHIDDRLARCERRFGDQVTRLDVHLKDTNADKGGVDKVCAMEAHPAVLKAVIVEADADDAYEAANAAAKKLERALEHRFARAGDD